MLSIQYLEYVLRWLYWSHNVTIKIFQLSIKINAHIFWYIIITFYLILSLNNVLEFQQLRYFYVGVFVINYYIAINSKICSGNISFIAYQNLCKIDDKKFM